MGVIGLSGNGSMDETSRTADFDASVKRRYEDHSRLLTQQSKALRDQLQATRYVITQLEVQGIPVGVSPKLYVRQLLKGRSKSTSGQPAPKPGTCLTVVFLLFSSYPFHSLMGNHHPREARRRVQDFNIRCTFSSDFLQPHKQLVERFAVNNSAFG